jgi:hypothetical protein
LVVVGIASGPPLSKSTFLVTFGLIATEAEMHGFWQGVSALFGQTSFAWTVLFVVCFACFLSFVFEASIQITFPIIVLGGLTAIAEHVMHRRN